MTSQEKINFTINKVVELFKIGNVPKSIALITFPPYKDIPSSNWSLLNRLIMISSDTSDSRGFKQWAEINRYPKKGSKAFHILAPKMRKYKKKEKDNDESQEKKAEEDKPKLIVTGFVPIPVFRYEDTEGDPVDYTPIELPDFPLIEKAYQWDIDVKGITFHGEFFGKYRQGLGEQIRLATPCESVFFHELAHAAHKRVKGELKGGQIPQQEIVAELSAQVLAQLVGTEVESTLGNSYKYIKKYAMEMEKDIDRACLSVIGDVEKVLNLILEPELVETHAP